MNPENASPATPSSPAAPQGGGGLSTPGQIEQLADQLTAAADALHARILREIDSYHGGPVPAAAQSAARKLLDDEQVLRQQADGMYADAATLIVHALAQSQQHVLKLTADATEKLAKLAKLYDAMGIVGRLLEISGAVLTANPVFIMRALEDLHHMLDFVSLHVLPPVADSPFPPQLDTAALPAATAAQLAAKAKAGH